MLIINLALIEKTRLRSTLKFATDKGHKSRKSHCFYKELNKEPPSSSPGNNTPYGSFLKLIHSFAVVKGQNEMSGSRFNYGRHFASVVIGRFFSIRTAVSQLKKKHLLKREILRLFSPHLGSVASSSLKLALSRAKLYLALIKA